MANTYKYRVNHVRCKVQDGDLKKVIKQVDWTIEATSENHTFVDTGFTTFLPDPDPNSFLDFDVIYNDQVIEWVKEVEGENIQEHLNRLDELLYAKENPTEIITRLNIDPALLASDESEATAQEEVI